MLLLNLKFPIWGNDQPNLLQGGAGHDTIFGYGENDTLIGGNGDDKLDGGWGNDRLLGSQGKDTLTGDYGDDSIEGGDDADQVRDLAGDDSIWGGAGNDDVFAGQGDDFVDGGPGHDRLDGGKGGDTIEGGNGDDTVSGSQSLGYEKDVLIGGAGADRFVFQRFVFDQRIEDFAPEEGDVIDISEFGFSGLTPLKAEAFNVGDDLLIRLDHHWSELTIANMQKSDMAPDWFVF